MKMKSLTILQLIFLCLSIFISELAFGNELDNTKVTKMETYGLHTEIEDGRYRVKTFVPRSFLLFNIDPNEPTLKGLGKKYVAATTQDGARIFIRKDTISTYSYKDLYGAQDTIFNKAYIICLEMQCDLNNDEEVLKVDAGEVFKITKIEQEDSEVIKLIGNRGNAQHEDLVEGYISGKKLDTLNLQGITTFATLKHPRYKFKTIESTELRTSCGDMIEKGKKIPIESLSDTDKRIIDAFSLAIKPPNEKILIFQKSFGGENKEIVYKEYEVTDQRSETYTKFFYVAQVIFRCNQQSILDKRIFIESVTMVRLDTNYSHELTPLGTPDNLYQYIGAPYMYSVNSSRHYFSLINKLSEQFGDRALAGFFFSEFNGSCKSQYRIAQDECQHNLYE